MIVFLPNSVDSIFTCQNKQEAKHSTPIKDYVLYKSTSTKSVNAYKTLENDKLRNVVNKVLFLICCS